MEFFVKDDERSLVWAFSHGDNRLIQRGFMEGEQRTKKAN
jgi:hypothetical protein